MNKKIKALVALTMGAVMCTSMVACNPDDEVTPAVFKQGTYRTTTTMMPSNWNEFTYADNNDTQILGYIGSSFFDYDYKFDEAKGGKYKADGSINTDAIVEGSYTTNYSAATKLEDVTSTVEAKWGYTAAQKTEGGYAWKITLRNDLKWDDGTAIKADDFVYSMKEILNPDFMNMRANTYYDTLRVKRSRAYFYKNQEATYPVIGSFGYETNADAITAEEDVHVNMYDVLADLFGVNARDWVDAEGNLMPQYLPYADETIYAPADSWTEGTAEDDGIYAAVCWYYIAPDGAGYGSYCEVGADYENWLGIKVVNTDREVSFDEVGMYKVDDYSFVILLDKSYQFLTEEGDLSYLSAYYMSSLPLVKQSLYESCKKAPAEGATLWTSNYNSSLETTASWGPYKLAEFQSGKAYKLVRNDNWYGYGMEEYKNQYNVTAIECECVEEDATKWMKFLAGEVDDAALDTDHIADYMNSKYTTYSPGTGTFGMQLYGNKTVLAASENNNGILAIDQFRQAFSLALNRNDIVETIWPGTSVACFGLMNDMYFWDVENGGVYRQTTEAKEGLLRAYGFTKDATTGKWSNGTLNDLSLQDAYDSLTGYNPVLAKVLVKEAYAILVANAEEYGYDDTKTIKIVYGATANTDKQKQRCAYLQNVLDDLCEDTGLEGKIELVFDASQAQQWSDAFRAGDTQLGFGYGFSGNPFNPFDIVGSFVNPDDSLNYHAYWDTTTEMMTLTLPVGENGADKEITMSLQNWYFCLNGLAEVYNAPQKYNWDAGKVANEVRLTILAALEEQVIKKSYSVMLIGDYSGSLLSPKFSQFSYDYNTFMGFGGIRYMIVNYTDAEFTQYVADNNNDLTNEYKKTE